MYTMHCKCVHVLYRERSGNTLAWCVAGNRKIKEVLRGGSTDMHMAGCNVAPVNPCSYTHVHYELWRVFVYVFCCVITHQCVSTSHNHLLGIVGQSGGDC